jgi:hypothetical protein
MTGMEFGHTRFEASFQRARDVARRDLCGPGEGLATTRAVHSFPNAARDHMCRYMTGDWLIMFDADMTFQERTVQMLVETQKDIEAEHGECGVLTAVYPKRDIPPNEVLIHDYYGHTNLWRARAIETLDMEKPDKCDASGAGCMLIMRWVIERIVLELNVSPFGVWGPLQRDSLHEPLGAGTDDLAFCRRLQVLDPPVQLWYTPLVTPGHLSTIPLTMRDWEAHQRKRVRVTMEAGDGLAKVGE